VKAGKNAWMAVNLGVPSNERPVLVYCVGNVSIGHYFCNGNIWRIDGEYVKDVTHWMEMPEPPEPVLIYGEIRVMEDFR
jgi:hypothetical protein